MSFELIRFVRELTGLVGHDNILRCARRAASAASTFPAYAAHALPGRAWEQATVAAPDGTPDSSRSAVRSALFAIHRKLSLSPSTLHLQRSFDTEPIFSALLSRGPAALAAIPLKSNSGRLCGALVCGWPVGEPATERMDQLETIASLTGPAMDVAWRHTQARRDQERLQLFSETTEESLWDWDLPANEVWWGGNLEQLFSGRARVSRRPDWRRMRIHDQDADRVISSFERALQGTVSSWNEQYRIRGADNEVIHVREHVYFLREVDGRAYRAIGTVRDISALQALLQRETQARASAERASAVKDEFLAMLGHELRNPLAPIVSVLSLLELRAKGPDRQLEILRRQTQHLVRLVDDLLDVSRISMGKVELDKRPQAVEPLVQRALEMVQPLFEQRRHEIEVYVEPLLQIDVDTARMTQVLSNLLANAAKYTEPGGHVQVRAEAEHRQAVIRDSGIGIAPEFLATIFDMFAQGPQALDRAQGGLGLGLSIVKNIVKLHGGNVEATSEGVGRGTEVIVRLPLATSHAETPPASMPDVDARLEPRSLLIVDDNQDAATLLEELLSMTGHTVRAAHHPHEALKLFAERRPDVALIDIGLPTMDGYELVRQMRLQPDSESTRYVALTGYGLASDKSKAEAAGFDAHLVKPVSPERLERLIQQLGSLATPQRIERGKGAGVGAGDPKP